ncbi:hypothetical protein MTBSS4_230037 [Magnetospirillum sp. SS-4]|nr:hypothetical protein MTBSS4_230037 [Magnetospirillum sp. SS-4]
MSPFGHVCPVRYTVLSVMARSSGRLLGLADVELDFHGVPVVVNSVRVQKEADGVSVRLPIDRDGRPRIDLPDEVKDGFSDVVLDAALEAGIVRQKVLVEENTRDRRRRGGGPCPGPRICFVGRGRRPPTQGYGSGRQGAGQGHACPDLRRLVMAELAPAEKP